ncbi:hypothetical protein P170DRAFT_107298 [Aspergillus steynii IBT 23096]|uniref:Uncharacterized protein n=1 Tax=Aspergillus steynii IBT 23096 TaxID=1392250 RepID=A0A2I2GIB2_9EURO|nr:uncharacterized protein P170DRAFT_107298 [Aspergillus steynii IBT 23096]PLB52612.1 hypothetical protein P170DRAFT_107298 [Aspergillus steynii IBT 23096]
MTNEQGWSQTLQTDRQPARSIGLNRRRPKHRGDRRFVWVFAVAVTSLAGLDVFQVGSLLSLVLDYRSRHGGACRCRLHQIISAGIRRQGWDVSAVDYWSVQNGHVTFDEGRHGGNRRGNKTRMQGGMADGNR